MTMRSAANCGNPLYRTRWSEQASSGKFYERKLREVTKRFPKLSKPLRSYFATAEQLYANFKSNTIIDFVLVLVEYCKVVEGALWEYLP